MGKVINVVFLPSGAKLPYNYRASTLVCAAAKATAASLQGRCPVPLPASLPTLECVCTGRGSDHRLGLREPLRALLPGQLQDRGLLDAAAPAFAQSLGRQALLLFLGLFRPLWVDDQEGGRQEAQERAHRGHHRDDAHSPDRIDHAAQGGGHQDLGDIDLAGEDGTVYAKATLGVPGAVVNVLQERRTQA